VTNKNLSSHIAQINSLREPDTLGCVWTALTQAALRVQSQFSLWFHRIPEEFQEFSVFREIPEYSRFSRFVATLVQTVMLIFLMQILPPKLMLTENEMQMATTIYQYAYPCIPDQ